MNYLGLSLILNLLHQYSLIFLILSLMLQVIYREKFVISLMMIFFLSAMIMVVATLINQNLLYNQLTFSGFKKALFLKD
jgi:hypothetical protein